MIPGNINSLLLAADAAGGYNISRSLRFNSADSAYLNRTPASAGNRTTWTWAGWVKRSKLGGFSPLFSAGAASSADTLIYFDSGSVGAQDSINWFDRTNPTKFAVRITTQVFRDISAWYHLVFVWDTNNGTAADRMRLYVNGVRVSAFASTTDPSSGASSALNNNVAHPIGSDSPATGYFDGYLADVYFIDGQALDPTSFGEFDADTGIWNPIRYTGTYPGNSFHLDFADNSTAAALGYDAAGSNDWTVNNLSVTAGAGNDSLVDVPVNGAQTDTASGGEVRGNYATFNPLSTTNTGGLANGNLQQSGLTNSHATIRYPSSGKWYFEVTPSQKTAGYVIGIQALAIPATPSLSNTMGIDEGGNRYNGDGTSTSGFLSAIGVGDTLGVAVDRDANTINFYRNGTAGASTLSPSTLGTDVVPFVHTNSATVDINFGQRPFAYTAPSGFKALCTANLPAPVVTKPNTVFDAITYTGNGSSQSITTDFSPDFVWLKSRSNGTYSHYLFDIVRGNTQILFSNSTGAESPSSTSLTSFNSTGFTVGSDVGTNSNGMPFIAWTWDAGSSTVTNTQGSITSSVRTNGYLSVVTYSGVGSTSSTVGHGLGVAPSFIIAKARTTASQVNSWRCYHRSLGATQYIELSSTAAAGTFTDWANTAPTSSAFYVGGTNTTFPVNENGISYVAYCFAPVSGYSNGFSYTGNGSTDGSFVYLGFRPRLILLKCSSTTGNWTLVDTAREGYNVDNDPLYPNLSDAEGTTDLLDITSNGFKLRTTDASVNSNAATYIGFAWAESPFNYSRAR